MVGVVLCTTCWPQSTVDRPSITFFPYGILGWDKSQGGVFDSGLDFTVKYKGLTGLGSISPDFRYVPKDILSLDFSYFERLPAETRPFFLAGRSYYSGVPLATQRIDTFDAAFKTYGQLDKKTSIGFLDAADFWQGNALAASLVHQMDKNGNFRTGFSSWREPEFENQLISAGVDYQLGPVRLNSEIRSSHDTEIGAGSYMFGEASYDRHNVFARVDGYQASANYLDRLDYFTETNIRGTDGSIGVRQPHAKGAVASTSETVFGSYYRYLNGDPYRKMAGVSGNATLRNGISNTASYRSEDFLDFHDHLVSLSSRGYRLGGLRIGAVTDIGNLAGHSYFNILGEVRGNVTKHLQIHGSIQQVKHFENREQSILGFDYDLGKERAITGRMVQIGSRVNTYAAYSFRDRAATYQLILGDPNSDSFRTRIALKAVYPLEVRF